MSGDSSGLPLKPERLESLDVFRGATIAAMLLVNNPGSWAHVYAPLEHAEWHGWTPTDLIFPFFLFVVGITTHLSIASRVERGDSWTSIALRATRRAALIFLFGIVLNAFPFYTPGRIPGLDDPTALERVIVRLETLRIPGVLQRIALVYAAIAAWEAFRLRRFSNLNSDAGATATLKFVRPGIGRGGISGPVELFALAVTLGGYWFLLIVPPVPDTGLPGRDVLAIPSGTITAWFDRAVFGAAHLWAVSKTWDPEGLLSTIPAIGTGVLGLFAGRWLRADVRLETKIRGLIVAGVCLVVAGQAWSEIFPINKNLWTSSYVVFTAGAASLGLASCIWIVDLMKWRRWARPFVVFGVNPILAFVGSGLLARVLTSLWKVPFGGGKAPVQKAVYETLFAPWFAPEAASLAYAIAFVLLWLGILWPLWKKGIYLKV